MSSSGVWDHLALVTPPPSGAAALIAGQLLGVDARYGPADTLAAATQQTPVGP